MADSSLEAKAHKLLGQLGPSKLAAVVHLLEVMVQDDDEPVTEEEERAVAASKEWFRNNPGIPLEEVVAELGFTME